ncbi:MAG: hypothetical protein RLZ55_401 [Actinomycetota bacterium]
MKPSATWALGGAQVADVVVCLERHHRGDVVARGQPDRHAGHGLLRIGFHTPSNFCGQAGERVGPFCRIWVVGRRRVDVASRLRCKRPRATLPRMARLICVTNVSLDGYIEDEDGRFDWTATDDELFAFITDLVVRPLGIYLYGRRLYQAMALWETDPARCAPSRPRPRVTSWWEARTWRPRHSGPTSTSSSTCGWGKVSCNCATECQPGSPPEGSEQSGSRPGTGALDVPTTGPDRSITWVSPNVAETLGGPSRTWWGRPRRPSGIPRMPAAPRRPVGLRRGRAARHLRRGHRRLQIAGDAGTPGQRPGLDDLARPHRAPPHRRAAGRFAGYVPPAGRELHGCRPGRPRRHDGVAVTVLDRDAWLGARGVDGSDARGVTHPGDNRWFSGAARSRTGTIASPPAPW